MTTWWSDYFDEHFLRIYRAVLPRERTLAEVSGLREVLGLAPPMKVLDVACGWGRHTVELARMGLDVTGVDASETLLAEAERLARKAHVHPTFVQADMRELPFEAEFDVVLSLFSSLGYFGDDGQDVRVLEGMHASARPGGRLVIDTMHRDLIAREFAERDWWETPEGDVVRVQREFDAIRGVSHEMMWWQSTDGACGEKSFSVRVRTPAEWTALLESAGWRPSGFFGSWEMESFTTEAQRLIIVSEVG